MLFKWALGGFLDTYAIFKEHLSLETGKRKLDRLIPSFSVFHEYLVASVMPACNLLDAKLNKILKLALRHKVLQYWIHVTLKR